MFKDPSKKIIYEALNIKNQKKFYLLTQTIDKEKYGSMKKINYCL